MPPIAEAIIVSTIGPDLHIHKMCNDVDVGECGAQGAAERLAEQSTALDLADDVPH